MDRTASTEDRSQSYTAQEKSAHVQKDPCRQVIYGPFVLLNDGSFDRCSTLHSSLDKVPNRALRGLN